MTELQIDTSKPIRLGEELDVNALNIYLREYAPEVEKVIEISQFPGGFSNLTYCLKTTNREYVLRRPPFGANIKGGHDMGREFRVLSFLQGHYNKTPTPITFCETDDVLGAPFYIMERIQGVILRTTNAPKLNLAPETLRKICEAIIDNQVILHSLDIEKTGLIQLGKPEGYVQRQVEGWIKRYYDAETDKIADLDATAEWMQSHQPTEQAPAFLHNDYKHDNIILNPHNLSEILGVLDWEMATVGDPLMDLGATLAYWTEANDLDVMKMFNFTWLPGNLMRQEVIHRYAEKSGRDLSNIAFYYVFGLYKNATIAQQIYARWKQGFSKDARFGGLLPVIQAMGRKAVQAVDKQSI